MTAINVANLDIVFGNNLKLALEHIDAGRSRGEIMESTGQAVGVHHANLSVHQGEIFVLMGLSGCGKSTLLRAINRLVPIARGEITVSFNDGPNLRHVEITRADNETIRGMRMHHIAMVFQNAALMPWKTVAENVAFGLEIARTDKLVIEQKVKENLALVGLSQWSDRMPHELSGGMQQRVGLARALATDANILLMDEPFSALDPLIRSHLQQELLHLQKTLHKTILFVTHDLDEALKIGGRIGIMQDGKIIQIGQAEDIVNNPKTVYVKNFVAHIDQTRLLRARAIMTSIADLPKHQMDSSIMLDENGRYRCLLDEGGRPRRSLCGDVEGRIIPWTLFQSGTFSQNDIVLGNEYLTIKDVIEAVGRTRKPMVIQDKAGKMIGAITTDSILHALAMK